ncbi:hypothetical protein [Syntrophorhabdus aromaticivorans]|nr:hypothetical protein [Syntrophorhabdus aromaticivorans]
MVRNHDQEDSYVQQLDTSQQEGGDIMAKNESTSAKVASKAGKLLSNPKTPKSVKSVAASALTQRPGKKGK